LQPVPPVEGGGADAAVPGQALQFRDIDRTLRYAGLGVVPAGRLLGRRTGRAGVRDGDALVIVFQEQEAIRVGLRLAVPLRRLVLRGHARDEGAARTAPGEQLLQPIGRHPVLTVLRDLVEPGELATLA